MIEQAPIPNDSFASMFVAEYMQLTPKLRSYLYAATRNAEISEDLVQDVFVKGWSWISRHTEDSVEFTSAWIWTITDHTLFDYLRRKKLILFIPLSLFGNEGNDDIIEDQLFAIEDESFDEVERFIDASGIIQHLFPLLDPKYQQILFLKYVLGLPFTEIQKILKLSSEDAAKMHALRARQQFRKLYYMQYTDTPIY